MDGLHHCLIALPEKSGNSTTACRSSTQSIVKWIVRDPIDHIERQLEECIFDNRAGLFLKGSLRPLSASTSTPLENCTSEAI